MAYNNRNHLRRVKHIIDVYNSLKEADIPDTRIVAKKLPEHDIHISYRSLMYYKSLKPSDLEPAQLTLFANAS